MVLAVASEACEACGGEPTEEGGEPGFEGGKVFWGESPGAGEEGDGLGDLGEAGGFGDAVGVASGAGGDGGEVERGLHAGGGLDEPGVEVLYGVLGVALGRAWR